MNHNLTLWLAAMLFSAGVVLQWVVLRARYRNEIFKQRSRHQQQQQATAQQLEQAKRQIGQLQHDLTAARLLAQRQAAGPAVPAPSPARPKAVAHSCARETPALQRTLPADGFAETLPAPQYPHDASLLMR